MNIIKKSHVTTATNDFQNITITRIAERFNLQKITLDESQYWGHIAVIESFDPFVKENIRLTLDDIKFLSELTHIRWIEVESDKLVVGI